MQRNACALFALLLMNATALAAPATQAEADRLAALLQSYVGDTKGVFTVKPVGEVYDVSVDATPLISKIPDSGETKLSDFKISPWQFQIADKGDGTWLVTQDKPIDMRISATDQLDLVIKVGSVNYSGMFDEKLKFFTSTKAELGDISFVEKISSAETSLIDVTYTLKSMHYESTNRESAPGIADGEGKLTYSGFHEDVKSAPSADGETPLEFSIDGGGGFQNAVFKGFKIAAVYEAASWLFNNADKEAKQLDAAQRAELKTLLEASLPIFQNISMKGGIENIVVVSPYGQFGLGKMGTEIEMNGAVKDGLFREAVVFEKLTMPDGMLPPYAGDFMPERLALDVKVTGFDMDAPARLALAEMGRLTESGPNPEFDAQMLKAFMPTGTVTVTLNSGALKGKSYDLDMDGSVVAGKDVKPEGKGTVRTKSLLPLITAMNALPAELGMGMASTGLIAFNSMAKKQADGTLLWDIEGTRDGKFLINGIDYAALAALGGMGGSNEQQSEDAPTVDAPPMNPDDQSGLEDSADTDADGDANTGDAPK